jgi:predicted flap endonuclease-1-like 5' DNA nuclease
MPMGWYIYIAEIAALLLVAYSIGWAIGFAARGLALRRPAEASIPASRLELARGETQPATVAATALAIEIVVAVTDPVPAEAEEAPPIPVEIDVQPLAEGSPAAVPAEVAGPAVVALPDEQPPAEEVTAVAATSPRITQPQVPELGPAVGVAEPSLDLAPAATIESDVTDPAPLAAQRPATDEPALPIPSADEFVVLTRATRTTPTIPVEAAPASTPGVAWTGEINGHIAPLHAAAVMGDSATAIRAATPDETAERPASPPLVMEPAPAVSDEQLPIGDENVASVPAEPMTMHVSVAPPMSEVTFPDSELTPAPERTEPMSASAPDAALTAPDEDAAMQAIEGGWSRSRAGAAVSNSGLAEVAAAVAAAQTAAQQAIELTGTPPAIPASSTAHGFGKPVGLPRPHDGRRDNLREIEGMSPLDESTLNNLGIYHFEQIAEWTPQEVFWLENHVFARGRIGRETWQLQARDLMSGRPAPSRLSRP